MSHSGESMNTPRLTRLGFHKSLGFYADYSEESSETGKSELPDGAVGADKQASTAESKLQTDTEMDAELLLLEKENYLLINEGKLLTKKQRLFDIRAKNILLKNEFYKQMDSLNATEVHCSRASRHQFDMQGQGHSNYHSQGHL